MEARGKKTRGKITNLVTPMRSKKWRAKNEKNIVFKLLGGGDPLKTQNSLIKTTVQNRSKINTFPERKSKKIFFSRQMYYNKY